MNNSYIPEIFKDKIFNFTKFLASLFFLFLSIALVLSLWSFSIDDNSFLTKSSNLTSNIMGPIGSYGASFLIYTFGFLSYFVSIFFLIYGIFIFVDKRLNYFFIRLFGFFICLVLIPQIIIFWGWQPLFINEIPSWGMISKILFIYHKNEFLSYALSVIGVIILFLSLNLFYIPKLKIRKLYQIKNSDSNSSILKKEPIINSVVNVSHSENNKIETAKNYQNNHFSNNHDSYSSPSLDILDNNSANLKNLRSKQNIQQSSELLERVFSDFNIDIKVINVKLGPVVTLYEILPAAGIKINTIINLADDISRSMGVGAVRIAQIYGTQYLGVEVPNDHRETVKIKELLSDKHFKNTSHKIPICVGKDISGNIEVIDLSKSPHLLVAGTTGSGKSVFVNTLLASLLYKFSPDQLRLILIDPKMLELSVYNEIAHLLTPVVTESKKAIITLKWVCKEMERRYSMMNEEATRNLVIMLKTEKLHKL